MRVAIKRILLLASLLTLAEPWLYASFPVVTSYAPANDLYLVTQAIQYARQSILVNIYDLSSPEIAQALIGRIETGVRVDILFDGQPVGGLSAAAKGLLTDVSAAMERSGSGSHLLEMTSTPGHRRRYRFDHAKYMVIDGRWLLIGSENYAPSGNPTAGAVGNRGWEVLVEEPTIAQQFANLFKSDINASYGDVVDLTKETAAAPILDPLRRKPAPEPVPLPQPGPINGSGVASVNADSVRGITSPENSYQSLINIIAEAKSSLDIEQMTIDPDWTGEAHNPLLDAIVAAARRGVRVRVLLNDETVFNHGPKAPRPKNPVTVAYLNQMARSRGIPLEAAIANLKAMGVDYIHNKGLLMDGNYTLVSSINWDKNSITNNRETAVLLQSTAVNNYYETIFNHDWEVSQGAPFASGREDAGHPAIECPRQIQLAARVGQLNLRSAADQDFESISGKSFEAEFIRTNAPGCVLANSSHNRDPVDRQFLDYHVSSRGEIMLRLEGYTPHSEIYSIRAPVPSGASLSGTFDASIYNGSAASRQRLGEAVLTVSVIQ